MYPRTGRRLPYSTMTGCPLHPVVRHTVDEIELALVVLTVGDGAPFQGAGTCVVMTIRGYTLRSYPRLPNGDAFSVTHTNSSRTVKFIWSQLLMLQKSVIRASMAFPLEKGTGKEGKRPYLWGRKAVPLRFAAGGKNICQRGLISSYLSGPLSQKKLNDAFVWK